MCEDGRITKHCLRGEFFNEPTRQCNYCPVGFYCTDGGSVKACSPGATTLQTRATAASDCFCTLPLEMVLVNGTAEGLSVKCRR